MEDTKKRRRGTGALLGAAGIGALLAVRRLRTAASYDFNGRVVIVTGGSRGLGLAIAREFAKQGAQLALFARDAAELQRAEQDLAARGAEVLTVPCDVRDQQAVNTAIEQVVAHYGRVDVLVNNAGVIQAGPIEHMTLDDFRDAMDTHLWASLYATLAIVPQMRRQGGGRIVNIASVGGKVSVPHLVPYCTSKFALVGLSDGMRDELAKDGIVITTVCPGLMRTGSHVNGLYKGKHRTEFSVFSIFLAQPFVSTSAPSAARQIVEACRHGSPLLVITPQAQLLILANTLTPGWISAIFKLTTRLLPGPTDAGGDQSKAGWESQTSFAPSPLTYLADKATDEFNELRGHEPLT
jgi:NAD(P)-dependent dehydrogenase (short-subunit alcohol dehydrogenase family)